MRGMFCIMITARPGSFAPASDSGSADTGATAPAGGSLQGIHIGAAGTEDGAGVVKAGLFVVGNAGNQVKPVLKTFHGSNSLSVTVWMNSVWRSGAE